MASTCNSHQQGEPVAIMKSGSKRSIRIWTHIVDKDTNVELQSSGFVQQIRLHTRIVGDQLFQYLS
jgi:hypothetical protein